MAADAVPAGPRVPRRLAAAVIAALAAPRPAAALRPERPLGPRDALRARLPLMLVVAPPDRALPDAEAIGDWAYFLNEAARDRPAGVAVARTTRAGLRDLLAAPAVRQDYATLFIRPNRDALLHEGRILDPPVYEAGFAFLRDGTPPPANHGLAAMRARSR